MIEVDGLDIGFWTLHKHDEATLMIHANILQEHRKHGLKAGHMVVDWFNREAPEQFDKLLAEIPTIYPDVYRFTKKFGFMDAGTGEPITKKGETVSQYLLELPRAYPERIH
jgi:hypothetical protein